jgi:hypothetical protein
MQLCMRAGEWGRDGAGRASAREAATTFAHILNAQLHDFLVHRTGLIGQFYTWWRGGEASHGPRDPKAGGGWGDATRRYKGGGSHLLSATNPRAASAAFHLCKTPRLPCLALRSPHTAALAGQTDEEERMGRGGIGGGPVAVDMETVDSTRAFVRDVKRIVIKVTHSSARKSSASLGFTFLSFSRAHMFGYEMRDV